MNPGDPSNPQQTWAAGQPGAQNPPPAQPGAQHPPAVPSQPVAPHPTQGFYPQPGVSSGQWSALGQQPWGVGQPAPGRQFDRRAQLPAILLMGSTLAGLITYSMGFVSWVVPDNSVSETQLDNWADRYGAGDAGIPGFASYEIILNPGKFLILLGAVAIAAALVLVPRFRTAVPFLAVIAAAAWLALFSAAVTITSVPVIGIGAGAIVALIFGFLQVVFLCGAAVLGGLRNH